MIMGRIILMTTYSSQMPLYEFYMRTAMAKTSNKTINPFACGKWKLVGKIEKVDVSPGMSTDEMYKLIQNRIRTIIKIVRKKNAVVKDIIFAGETECPSWSIVERFVLPAKGVIWIRCEIYRTLNLEALNIF